MAKEALFDSFEKWSRKISPILIRLLGGEPLLNPDVAEIAMAARHYWMGSQCEVVTNGVLLPRISEDILQIFREHNIRVFISQHMNTQEYREVLNQSLARLEQLHVQYTVCESYRYWGKNSIDASGIPTPAHSNHIISYNRCGAKRCTAVIGDYMHRCTVLGNMILARKEMSIGQEWDMVLTHKPASFQSSPQEIVDYLHGGAMPECSVCLERGEIVESRQLSTEEVRRIKQDIQQRNRKAA